MRYFYVRVLICLFLMLIQVDGLNALSKESSDLPNLVVFVVDDLGWQDISEPFLFETGHAHYVQDLDTQEGLTQEMTQRGKSFKGYVLEYLPLKLNNKAFRNNGDLTFIDKSTAWGFEEKDISHWLAVADPDNDRGLASKRLKQEEAAIYENTTSAPRTGKPITFPMREKAEKVM